VHPFASAIDTELPKAPSSVHLLMRDKAAWVEPKIGPNDDCFDGYPELSIEEWHKKHGCGLNDGITPKNIPSTDKPSATSRKVRS
jgi:hypothetical protein